MNLRAVALALALSGLGSALPARSALAQTEAQKQKAREHSQSARRLYDLGRYKEAIEEYEKAYLNVEEPVFLFNIAQAYRLDGQAEEAVRAYRAYLRKAPDAPNRADVEQRIAELQRDIEAARNRPAPAATSPPPPPQPLPVAPPPVAAPPPAPSSGPDLAATTGAVPDGDVPEDARRARRRKVGYVLVGTGGGAVLLGTVFGVMANGKARELERATVFDPEIEKSGKSLSAVATVFTLAGLASAGIGVYLLLDSGGLGGGARAGAPPRESGLALQPLLGPGLAGAGASWRF